jgi:hypothetical protein
MAILNAATFMKPCSKVLVAFGSIFSKFKSGLKIRAPASCTCSDWIIGIGIHNYWQNWQGQQCKINPRGVPVIHLFYSIFGEFFPDISPG